MPYQATRELPPAVRRTLTPAQQRVYIEAFNRAWARGWSEARCHAYAWAAAKRAAAKEDTTMRSATAQLLRDLAALMDSEETGEVELEKAAWTRAYINDLPDSAFLYIAPGGRKDEDGKTVPRSLRYFPYRDASGAIDLPHLRNAIARAPQSNLPRAVVERIQERARRLLAEAATKCGTPGTVLKYDDERQVVYGVVYEPHVVDAQGDYADEDAILDAAHAYMLGGAVVKLDHAEETDQATVVESYIAPVDFELGGEAVRAGSWVMAVKVADAELWGRVRGGEYEGYSFGGEVLRTGGDEDAG